MLAQRGARVVLAEPAALHQQGYDVVDERLEPLLGIEDPPGFLEVVDREAGFTLGFLADRGHGRA